jgi:hypothetical protein
VFFGAHSTTLDARELSIAHHVERGLGRAELDHNRTFPLLGTMSALAPTAASSAVKSLLDQVWPKGDD